MSLWMLASPTVLILGAWLTGRVWVVWLAIIYAVVVLGLFFYDQGTTSMGSCVPATSSPFLETTNLP